jgi:hypothetical protein
MPTRSRNIDTVCQDSADEASRGTLNMGPPPISMSWQGPTTVKWIRLKLDDGTTARQRMEHVLERTPDVLTPTTLAHALEGFEPDDVVVSIAGAESIGSCLRDATTRAPRFERLPAIAPVIADSAVAGVRTAGQVAQPRPEDTQRCDIWTFLAIRSRIRGNAFVKASTPYLTATDLIATAYVRVPATWSKGRR